jgi:multiple sugar transport system permease protein
VSSATPQTPISDPAQAEIIVGQAETAPVLREEKRRERIDAYIEERTPTQIIGRVLLYAALAGLTVLYVAPFVWLISNSLKDAAHVFDDSLIPSPIRLDNYPAIFQELNALTQIKNSLIVSISGVVLVAISSAMVGFSLARLRFPGANIVFLLVLATMMLPGQVTMVPVFLIWNFLRQVTGDLTGGTLIIGTNTLWPLFLSNAFGSSFYIFMMRQFFLGIPGELIEAARVDGASYFRIFWQIMLPLVRPALVAVGILEFEAKWNDFLGPLIYTQREDLFTLARGVQIFAEHQGFGQFNWQLIFAAAVVMSIPTITLFLFAQKQFIQGVSTSGLKG